MKSVYEIESVELFLVGAGWRDWIFVKIRSLDGTIGWSECTESNGSPEILVSAIMALAKDLIGLDCRNVKILTQTLRFKVRQSLPGLLWKAISALENALWDISSKCQEQRISEIVGMSALTVDSYAWPAYWSHCPTTRVRASSLVLRPHVSSLDDLTGLVSEIKINQFRAIKSNLLSFSDGPKVLMPGFSKTVGTLPTEIPDDYANEFSLILKRIEELSNNSFQLIVDMNYNVSPHLFKKLEPSLRDTRVRWVEIDFDEITAFNEITSSTSLPLCSGENLLTLWNYRALLANPAVQIISIDLLWNGLTESLRIAQSAIKEGKKVTIHNYYGSFATSMALMFASMLPPHCVELFEFDFDDVPWRDDIVEKKPILNAGNLVFQGGLGWNNSLLLSESNKFVIHHERVN